MTGRDLVGYGQQPLTHGSTERIALSFVLNYEGRRRADAARRRSHVGGVSHEVSAPPSVGLRRFERRVDVRSWQPHGFWRVHRTSRPRPRHGLRGRSRVERTPQPAGDGRRRWRWRATLALDRLRELSEDEERHTSDARSRRRASCGIRPVGWYTGRTSESSDGSSSRREASSTTRTRTPTSCRTGSRSPAATTSSSPTRSTRTISSSCCRTGSSPRTTSSPISWTRSTSCARKAGE
jgi:hypothetical protein